MRAPARRRGDHIWTAASAEPTEIPVGNSLTFPVVDVIVDTDNPIAKVHCTLLRMRGWLEICVNEITADINFAYMIVAYVLDDDEDPSTSPPGSVGTYTHEDVLWTNGGFWFSPSAVPIDFSPGKHHEIDIKAKRKITSGKTVHVNIQNVGAGSLAVSGVIRGLVLMR